MDKRQQILLEEIDRAFEENECVAIVKGRKQKAFSCYLSQPNTWRNML